MLLYHHRSVKNAIKEIEQGTLHFSTRDELNDPMEGYLRVFWQGDTPAWQGLLKNYVCSVYNAITIYLLQGGEGSIHHNSLVIDIHQYDEVPLGGVYSNLCDVFLADKDVQRLADALGKSDRQVQAWELTLILHFLHSKALAICLEIQVTNHTIPDEEVRSLLSFLEKAKVDSPHELIKTNLLEDTEKDALTKVSEDLMEDMRELQYLSFGQDDEAFLYGKRPEENDASHTSESSVQRQHRDWLSIAVDYPRVYVDQLKGLLYPEAYMCCFSDRNNNSSMWGNYADNHKGVCLIFETDENQRLALSSPHRGKVGLEVRKIKYEGDQLERNFFESFGRLTHKQIQSWLTGIDGISKSYHNIFKDQEKWQKQYWDAFNAKNHRKVKAWEHESEYRVTIDNSFGQFTNKESRNLLYASEALKGVIFGIRTSEYDKKRIVDSLLTRTDLREDFLFQQAEFDSQTQSISIRNKGLWRLETIRSRGTRRSGTVS